MSPIFHLPKIVYHATLLQHYESINDKILIHREDAKYDLDFGKGFYTTSNYQQAEERALLLQERERDQRSNALKREHRGIIISFEVNTELLYTVEEQQRKFFLERSEEWARYIVYNRVQRKENHPHNYKWTYGSLADGNSIGFLCKKFIRNEINVSQLIHGYMDEDEQIKGISPISEDYDQLSFHEDEDLVNAALKLHKFDILQQQNISAQKRW
ncbi:DUF3990 domain-containing protein [Paenibacillus filicis]|uniref:DUF3990 domain-containing protein n=1 Tax=Paenibacillus gyeongsangnamensis TaxID=3388067 RepID=A0ABT4Q6L2_9BACL|nr:DUF3990 domain-containing protein [Paenibacillus filicis]MCZ8512422.1 DUF3990 domain-containing protein [Paenibacillus filicis]